jgi:hypothetical protein
MTDPFYLGRDLVPMMPGKKVHVFRCATDGCDTREFGALTRDSADLLHYVCLKCGKACVYVRTEEPPDYPT